jgi:multidrug transporter EmrE-like cation transporter
MQPSLQSVAAYIQAGASHCKDPTMSSTKIIAIVLIIAGVLGLALGKFSYTKETHDAKVGPIELSVKDKETVNVPMWAGIGAIVVGAGLLLAGGRRT